MYLTVCEIKLKQLYKNTITHHFSCWLKIIHCKDTYVLNILLFFLSFLYVKVVFLCLMQDMCKKQMSKYDVPVGYQEAYLVNI